MRASVVKKICSLIEELEGVRKELSLQLVNRSYSDEQIDEMVKYLRSLTKKTSTAINNYLK